MSGSSILIDAVEEFFGSSTRELLTQLQRDPAPVAQRREAFLDHRASRGRDPVPARKAGELRPLLSHRLDDVAGGGVAIDSSPTSQHEDSGAGTFALDVRSLLLYAHSVALPDPFAPTIVIGGEVGRPRIMIDLCSEQRFARALDIVCRLAPLLRSAVVVVVPAADGLSAEEQARLNETLEEVVKQVAMELVTARVFRWTDQTDLYLRARTLAERYLRQDIALGETSPEEAGRLIACEAERVALPTFAAHTARARRADADTAFVLDELMRLKLQGAGRIPMRDIAAIRAGTSFTTFRDDMATAIETSAASGPYGTSAQQAEIVADEMRAAAERLGIQTRRSAFLDATLGDMIGWAVGSAVGAAFDGWKGAIAGIAAKGAAEVGRPILSPSKRALRRHYVELSRPADPPTRSNARRRLLTEG